MESAKRVLRSGKATESEKAAAAEILRGAVEGKLEVHVVRTSHVLGEPTVAVLEQTTKATGDTAKLAFGTLDDLSRTATRSGQATAGTCARSAAGGARVASAFADGTRNAGRLVSNVAKTAVVVSVGVDVAMRVGDAVEVEHLYAEGEITQHERRVKHAENAGGFIGGWTGAAAGAKGGAAVGTAIGALFGGIGAPVGTVIGGLGGGIGGYFAGAWAGSTAAESAMNASYAE